MKSVPARLARAVNRVFEGWADDLEFELAVHQGNALFAWASETYESLQACDR
jgi:hypothetical protein